MTVFIYLLKTSHARVIASSVILSGVEAHLEQCYLNMFLHTWIIIQKLFLFE